MCFPSTVTTIVSQCREQILNSLKWIYQPYLLLLPLLTLSFPLCKPPGCAAKRQILSSLQHVQKTPSIAEQQWCFSTAYMRISSSLFTKENHSACRNPVSLPRSTSVFLEGEYHPLNVSTGCCSPVYLQNESLLLTNIVGIWRCVSANIPTENLDKCFHF